MDEALLLDILLNSTNEAIVIVDKNGIITVLSQAYLEFLGIKKEDAIGKHVSEVIENTRMHTVLQTGKAEIADTQKIKKQTMVATRIPIYKNGEIVGAFGRVLFKNIKELYALNDRIVEMESQLSLYRSKYGRINEAKYTLSDIIGNSAEIVELRNTIKKIAVRNSNILITGESGTGKELVAHAIHNASSRRKGPMVCVNCAAIPSELLESELFGYEEGAFTGAKKGGNLGKFELADKGTIFLDEIGDMSLHLQAKLLRVLQEKELNKIGANSNKIIDIRVIAATNKDLESMVSNGLFREDLYYRLNVIPINLPSLRERREDIPLLIDFMVKDYARKLNKDVQYIDENAVEVLKGYNWAGNIRELQNIIEYSVNMSSSNIITVDMLPSKVNKKISNPVIIDNEDVECLEGLERREIIKALNKYKDYKRDKELVAKALGISRATLYRKLDNYNIISK